MSNTNHTTRLFCMSHDEAVQACSDIDAMVYTSLGLTGIKALTVELALYSTLYAEVCQLNATPAALHYIEKRRSKASAELDIIRSCSPDLFDGYCVREGIEQLLQAVAA